MRLEDITISFQIEARTVQVVDQFFLTLAGGELHCIAGRSGSGKTSVLRVAGGFQPPTSGAVHWGEVEVTSLKQREREDLRRAAIGYLDQAGELLDNLTALENVMLPAMRMSRAHREPSVGRARSLLARLQLSTREGNFPRTLSGGESHRVALARALLMNSPVLIVDEPTASLDRETADIVIDLLLEHARNGALVLVSSHDPALIEASDSVTVLENWSTPHTLASEPTDDPVPDVALGRS